MCCGCVGEAAGLAHTPARLGNLGEQHQEEHDEGSGRHVEAGGVDYGASVEAALDEIAAALEEHLDIDALVALAMAGGRA